MYVAALYQHAYVCVCTLQHTATHCNTLQHTATHCNTLQHTATHCLVSARVRLRVHVSVFLYACALVGVLSVCRGEVRHTTDSTCSAPRHYCLDLLACIRKSRLLFRKPCASQVQGGEDP